ncbi:hypothetical protein [Pareuzebyella sediminis]|uniref:hypothetical protein n=1 Tax=Pareuzebyella sediminis TaxID=2607998 RepID=UPI0011F07668|nr:hypothetical protein [Pareuzebyella sediminis]
MKKIKIGLFAILVGTSISILGQDNTNEYLEFNDRNNVVHGVYLGLTTYLGEIEEKVTYMGGLKVAYVANQQFEVGLAGTFLYSRQDVYRITENYDQDLIGAYGGLHLEPIFFSKHLVNLSFPILIGAGAVGYIDNNYSDHYNENLTEDDFDAIFIIEPGISALFNISRYVQLEAGVKYRFSSELELEPNAVERINGLSAGLGIKVGVFNMGRNRYKKNI